MARKGILGTKMGMTQVFDENNKVVPVTVVKAGPNVVTGIRTPERDGYSAIQLAYGEISPTDPKNAVIVDLALAPRNANGNVEYAFDFYILKPTDLSKGKHQVMYEPPNRGRCEIEAFVPEMRKALSQLHEINRKLMLDC